MKNLIFSLSITFLLAGVSSEIFAACPEGYVEVKKDGQQVCEPIPQQPQK